MRRVSCFGAALPLVGGGCQRSRGGGKRRPHSGAESGSASGVAQRASLGCGAHVTWGLALDLAHILCCSAAAPFCKHLLETQGQNNSRTTSLKRKP